MLSSGPLGFQILGFFEMVYILYDQSAPRLMQHFFIGPAGQPAEPVKFFAGPLDTEADTVSDSGQNIYMVYILFDGRCIIGWFWGCIIQEGCIYMFFVEAL